MPFTRLLTVIDAVRGFIRGDDENARSRRMALLNRVSRAPLTGDGPVVSLTTHGDRVRRVHLTIETIGRGTVKPSEIFLWLDEPEVVARPPRTIKRLQRRGLSLRLSKNFGPHTKYYPYLLAHDSFDRPLVTADDDMLYPFTWLAGLADASKVHPDEVLCYRARRV